MEVTRPQLPEVDVDPVGDMMLDWLIAHDREEPYLDFKETLDISRTSPFPKIAKDIFAFSNFGGGFILLGFRHKSKGLTEERDDSKSPEYTRNYVPVGLGNSFHIDQATLQEKFNAYSNEPLVIGLREFARNIEGIDFKLGVVYIPASASPLKPVKEGLYSEASGKKKSAFTVGEVLFRRGTQSVPATKQEILWIEQRSEKEQYRMSVLSGNPDRITETLFSNFLEVTKLPETIWTGWPRPIEENGESKLNRKEPYRAVYIKWNGQVVTFDDLSNTKSPLFDGVITETIESESLASWIEDSEKRRVLTYLLNKELRFHAYDIGLVREEKRNKFYFECIGETRAETWQSRYRDSSRVTVAQKMWAEQLHKFIFWHMSLIASFVFLDSHAFLRLSPSLLITEDGKRAIFGSKEGTVITRLTYNRHNSSYLNNLLFWASRFSGSSDKIVLARGKVAVLAKLSESKIAAGILADRPSSEPMQENPTVEVMEE